MRKFFSLLTACALCCALFSGCQKSADSVQPALDFRTALMGASECRYAAEVTADFGARVYGFTLDCSFTPSDGAAKLTVTAPDTISGISATVDGETAQVEFDDVRLDIGTMAGGHVAPMQLPQLLGEAWSESFIVCTAEEGEGWLATYQSGYDEDALDILTYFSAQGVPYLAEIYAEGSCILSAQIDNFSMA